MITLFIFNSYFKGETLKLPYLPIWCKMIRQVITNREKNIKFVIHIYENPYSRSVKMRERYIAFRLYAIECPYIKGMITARLQLIEKVQRKFITFNVSFTFCLSLLGLFTFKNLAIFFKILTTIRNVDH